MALTGHEAFELNELLLSCTNSIQSMGFFIHSAKDPELKAMIQKHMAAHVQDYNMKIEFASKGSAQQKLAVPMMPAKMLSNANTISQAVTPNPQATAFDDRAIAVSYLLTLKRAGREYAWATFEANEPQLRSFLEDAFTMCSRHAFEVSQWLEQRGHYPVENAPIGYLQKLTQTYQPVRQMAGVH
ncbi:spore coat protein [Alicyclobacillus tolerans]|uniref:spore coat protein n=1 Tax=Alicyclobacillus tolerans TaxID=90970 RepID=UPI001F3FFE7A|nr:spore coat protein [Alicyclobacillus tolerans]MCF8563966.1 spore coat protein [Alicyclobacillus tolerans]